MEASRLRSITDSSRAAPSPASSCIHQFTYSHENNHFWKGQKAFATGRKKSPGIRCRSCVRSIIPLPLLPAGTPPPRWGSPSSLGAPIPKPGSLLLTSQLWDGAFSQRRRRKVGGHREAEPLFVVLINMEQTELVGSGSLCRSWGDPSRRAQPHPEGWKIAVPPAWF